MKIGEIIIETIMQGCLRPRLKEKTQLDRFAKLSQQYGTLCERLKNGMTKSGQACIDYDWHEWSEKIRSSFQSGVPVDFLNNAVISSTMVFAKRCGIQLTKRKVKYIISVFGCDKTSTLLKEDYIGLPTISNPTFMTSANRSHHASHLACYTHKQHKEFWDTPSIIEWGGGYGDMARIIRKMNPSVTYSIIDLPEVLVLQYIYLSSLEGKDNVHLIYPGSRLELQAGKINLIPSHVFHEEQLDDIDCESFLSTWALSESPKKDQVKVFNTKFFNAKNLLLGSKLDKSNYLTELFASNEVSRILAFPNPDKFGFHHEYWFK